MNIIYFWLYFYIELLKNQLNLLYRYGLRIGEQNADSNKNNTNSSNSKLVVATKNQPQVQHVPLNRKPSPRHLNLLPPKTLRRPLPVHLLVPLHLPHPLYLL